MTVGEVSGCESCAALSELCRSFVMLYLVSLIDLRCFLALPFSGRIGAREAGAIRDGGVTKLGVRSRIRVSSLRRSVLDYAPTWLWLYFS